MWKTLKVVFKTKVKFLELSFSPILTPVNLYILTLYNDDGGSFKQQVFDFVQK